MARTNTPVLVLTALVLLAGFAGPAVAATDAFQTAPGAATQMADDSNGGTMDDTNESDGENTTESMDEANTTDLSMTNESMDDGAMTEPAMDDGDTDDPTMTDPMDDAAMSGDAMDDGAMTESMDGATESGDSTTPGQPGFGVLVVLLAVLGVILLASARGR